MYKNENIFVSFSRPPILEQFWSTKALSESILDPPPANKRPLVVGWFGVDLDWRWIGFHVFALFWIVFILVWGRFVLARDGLR